MVVAAGAHNGAGGHLILAGGAKHVPEAGEAPRGAIAGTGFCGRFVGFGTGCVLVSKGVELALRASTLPSGHVAAARRATLVPSTGPASPAVYFGGCGGTGWF